MVAQVAESPCAFWKSKRDILAEGSSQSILKALRSGIQSGMLHQLADADRCNCLAIEAAAEASSRRMQAQRKKQLQKMQKNRRRQSGQQLRRRQRQQPETNDE